MAKESNTRRIPIVSRQAALLQWQIAVPPVYTRGRGLEQGQQCSLERKLLEKLYLLNKALQ